MWVIKFFHFSIKITPLDLTKIRQHKDCTVVKPEIQKSPVHKKNTLPIFPKKSNLISSQLVFLKTMHAYFTKDIYIYKMSHFNFYYVYFTPYLIYIYNIASRIEDPGKVFRLRHLHLKNYLKTENCEPNGLSVKDPDPD